MMKSNQIAAAAQPLSSITNIVDKSPTSLRPWPNNPRTHNDKQLAKLKACIQKFGFTVPPIVDESGTILSGHGRVQAAIELKLDTIPVRILSGLTEAQKRAYVIADNKLGQLSGWDENLLKQELFLLSETDFEIELTGFSTAEIDVMFDDGSADADTADPDDCLPEKLPSRPISQLNDLWILGHHHLLCGNALDGESYSMLLQDQLAQMVITDPPYNVPISGHVCGNGKVQHTEFAMASGEMSEQEFTSFLNTAISHLHTFSQDGAIHFYFMDWRHIRELQDAAQPLFGPMRQLCVWVKDNGGMGSFYRSQHELVFVFKKGEAPHINNFELGQHGRYRTNVWNYPGVNTLTGKNFELLSLHPTVKPVGLIADAIRDCSHRKGIVLDPFAGSGTVLLAAERTGRYARAIELDPKYVDVAIMRWQQMTGKQAVLGQSGLSWSEVQQQRTTNAKGGANHGL